MPHSVRVDVSGQRHAPVRTLRVTPWVGAAADRTSCCRRDGARRAGALGAARDPLESLNLENILCRPQCHSEEASRPSEDAAGTHKPQLMPLSLTRVRHRRGSAQNGDVRFLRDVETFPK